MGPLAKKLQKMEGHRSLFESAVRQLPLPVCAAFGTSTFPGAVRFTSSTRALVNSDSTQIAAHFPRTVRASGNTVLDAAGINAEPSQGKRVAVLFSGGPAAGGHNVLCGIKRVLGRANTLFGVRQGPKGLLKGQLFEITEEDVHAILNTGGFDFLGTDRTKIKSEAQFQQVRETCRKYALDALIVIGGDDSNTNAAVLAERLFEGVRDDGGGVLVIGVPKTIDGDLQFGDLLPISFGFDTATRIYSEMVGNILQDARSSLKYWHFIKLMGRAASHVTLEVALQTKPAITLISEEVADGEHSLGAVIDQVAKGVVGRAEKGLFHGVVLVPEGLIEFIPEIRRLIAELNDVLAHNAEEFSALHAQAKPLFVQNKLSDDNARLLGSLPDYIVDRLLTDRDSHGNLQVSLIPTEQLLVDMVRARVAELNASVPFSAHCHFLGYEGRCGAPTPFDAAYTYNLGLTAGSLVLDGRTGYMATITNLDSGWCPKAIPLTGLLTVERRHGQDEFVIEKALVRMDLPAMRYFLSRRAEWADDDLFASPGPRQFWGPSAQQMPVSVALNIASDSLAFRIE